MLILNSNISHIKTPTGTDARALMGILNTDIHKIHTFKIYY